MTVHAASGPRAALVGQTVSHYRVLRAVGGGGMGEVYEAEDLNLRRHVALKFLSSSRERSPEAVQRLEREARAASALNHPHICTIHDIGEHEGERFIAMELLEGETVRDRLLRGPFDLPTFLRVGIEVADALDAAHRAHIIHRDVTPSNVFLTRDGHAKLLDFGLAKQSIDAPTPRLVEDLSTETMHPMLTSPGAIVGTVAYMSPEQVRGEELDHRTDLFSFGAVLYEMATGTRAFMGKTSALIFDAILHATPRPVRELNPSLPAGLQPIVDKALERDRRLRYHTADDLRTDLERLKRGLNGEVRPRLRSTRLRPRLLVWAATAIVGVAAYLLLPRGDRVPDAVPREVTSGAGMERDPAISPDGHTLAYSSADGGSEDIWLTDVNGGPARRLTSSESNETQPQWFPDGRRIAFVSDRTGGASVWVSSALDGDAATMVVPEADNPAISPDGTRIAFVRLLSSGYARIFVASLSNPADARSITGDGGGRWDHSEPAWSPDGRQLCYSAWDGLWVTSAVGAGVRQLTAHELDRHPAWSADGRHVYFTAGNTLWRVPSAGGTRQRVTLGSGSEGAPDVSRDGQLLAFSSASGQYDLVLTDREAKREEQFGTGRDDVFPSFDPARGIVYFVSNRWGALEIWRQHLGEHGPTGVPERVFGQSGMKTHPAISPDGRWLAYYRIADGERDVWVVDVEGGAPNVITTDGSSFHPSWSPDAKALVYVSERDGGAQLWTQSIRDGRALGQPVRVTSERRRYLFPVWSPDGHTIAFITVGPTGHAEVAVVSREGGRSRLITEAADALRARWIAPPARLLVAGLWGAADYEIRTFDVTGGSIADSRPPLRLGSDPEGAAFDVSPDGRSVLAARGRDSGHIWILEAQSSHY